MHSYIHTFIQTKDVANSAPEGRKKVVDNRIPSGLIIIYSFN